MNKKDSHLFKPLSYLENLGQNGEVDAYVSFMKDEINAYPSIRNIGVIGPYGSGKSSVVHSFLNNEDKDYENTLFFSQETIAEHLYIEQTNKENGKKPSDSFHLKVKKAIYLELLKYDTSSILLKEYNERLLNKRKWRSIASYIAFGFVAIALSFSLFAFLNFIKNWDFLISFLLSFALLNVFAVFFFAFYIKSVSLSFHSNKVDGKAELLPIRNYDDISNQINNHPTELDNLILFIIERNKIKYFVIEDMERLRKEAKGQIFNVGEKDDDVVLEIIKQFKILNDLINRSKIVKRPVRFIYGLNDECFDDSEVRSKFFDLIVPVVPLSTYSSAAQAIAEEPFVKQLIDSNELSKSTINSISLHFKNQRQINALLAQFYLNCQKLSHYKMYDKVFAITSLMVLFPHFSHSLYDKNNSLDLLLSEKWSLNNGAPMFESGREFPKDILNDKDNSLAAFLFMCIHRELITKSYRLLLTAHKLADNSILSEKDVELLIAFFSGLDISDERFENPENVLERIDDSDFIKNPSSFYPQLLDCMVDQDDKNKLRIFKESVDSMQNQKEKEKLLKYLINECEPLTINYIAEIFVSTPFVYNMVSSLKEERNYLFAFMLLAKCKADYLKNNKALLKDFLSFVGGSAFLKNQKEHLHPTFVEKLINSDGYMAEDISVFKGNDDVLSLFKKHPCFKMCINNLATLYPNFITHPFAILNVDKEVCNAFLNSADAPSILEECQFDNNIKPFVTFFLNRNIDNGVSDLLDSKYFDPWRFEITLGSDGDFELSLGQSRISALFTHDLLDLNSAFSKWYSANGTSAFINHIKESASKINKYKPKIGSELAFYLFNNLTKEELITLAELFDYSFLNKNVTALNIEKLMAIIIYVDDNNIKELLKIAASENEVLFNSISEIKEVGIDAKSEIALTKLEIANIFEKNLLSYYPLVLSSLNYEAFKLFVNGLGEGNDLAKLIFLGDGTLRKNINPDSLSLICKYEIHNEGALIKVFESIDNESLKCNGWIDFIKEYINLFGSQDRFNKLSFPINEINSLIYNKFKEVKRVFGAKGQSKNKLYFTINEANILF